MNKERSAYVAEFKNMAEQIFARSEYRSVLLAVSQYWADEAGDAVHATVVASRRERPVWPHLCAESAYDDEDRESIPGEGCVSCDEEIISWPGWWDDNGDAVLAFEAWCHEAGSQEEPDYKNALPCLLAVRTPHGAEVSFVGKIERIDNLLYQRDREEDDYDPSGPGTEPSQDAGQPDPAWGDNRALVLLGQATDEAGTRVLADYLLEQGFARGELIATGLDGTNPIAKARYDQLLAEQLGTWLHPLHQAVPEETAVFEHGLLIACDVSASEAQRNQLYETPALRTVRRLRAHGSSVLSPLMTSLRELTGPIGPDWLDDLISDRPWRIEKLEVYVNDERAIELLRDNDNLTNLRELWLNGELAEQAVAELPRAVWWKQLHRLAIADRDIDAVARWQPRHAKLGVPWLAIQQHITDPTDALGWEIAFGPAGAAEATLRGYTPGATFAELHRLVALSPIKPALVASEYYAPLPTDLG